MNKDSLPTPSLNTKLSHKKLTDNIYIKIKTVIPERIILPEDSQLIKITPLEFSTNNILSLNSHKS